MALEKIYAVKNSFSDDPCISFDDREDAETFAESLSCTAEVIELLHVEVEAAPWCEWAMPKAVTLTTCEEETPESDVKCES